jgi:hypothetical protein
MSCEFTLTWTDANGDTLVLTDPDTGIEMMLGGIGFDVPPMSNTTAGYVSLDGSTLVKRRRDARPLTFGLYIRDAVRLRTVVSDVARALQGPGVLTFDDDTNVRSLFNVIYDGGLEGEWSADMGLQRFGWRKLVVSMLALNPWWHDEETSATTRMWPLTGRRRRRSLFSVMRRRCRCGRSPARTTSCWSGCRAASHSCSLPRSLMVT